MEKYIPCKWKEKKAGVAILISDKIDLKIKKIARDKEGYYIMIKGSFQEEHIAIVNIYAPNTGATQYTRQTLTDTRRDKKAFLSDQCRKIEETNRVRKIRDLVKKIRDTKGTFHAKMGSIKDRNGMDLTEAEDIKKRW